MTDIATLNQELDAMILQGQALDAFERFYAEDIVMQENSQPPYVGKDFNRQREKEFFGSVQTFHGAEVRGSAAADDISFSEWMMDVTFQDGTRKVLEQTTVRRWRDGQVVNERFYYDTAG